MSIKYQKKLIDLVEGATRVDCLFTELYRGFYIHSGVYDGVCIFSVTLIGCATFYSKSLAVVRARIRQFKLEFNL